MANNQIKIDLVNSDHISTLIDLLSKYKDELPCDLKEEVKRLSSLQHKHIIKGLIDGFKFISGGVDMTSDQRWTGFNLITKTAKYFPIDEDGKVIICSGAILEREIELKDAEIYSNDNLVGSW